MDTDFHTEIEEEFYRNFDQRVTSKKCFVVVISVFVYALYTMIEFYTLTFCMLRTTGWVDNIILKLQAYHG